jgi:uncharacterized protein (TIGR00661 family)
LNEMLQNAGHEVSAVFIGKSKRREIPSYFKSAFECPVHSLRSPNFITDPENKSIKIGETIFKNAFKGPIFLGELLKIRKAVKAYQPHVVVNFYDILGGFYNLLFGKKTKMVAISHQFLADHPDFPFAKGTKWDKRAYLLLNTLTGYGSAKRLCLSFRPYSPFKNLIIVPPLLRSETKRIAPSQGDFIHGYMVNDGYSEEVIRWHNQHSSVPLYFFWDKKNVDKETIIDEHLTFHTLDDQLFLQKMAASKAYVSTAGFESICEAMYLGKPLMMVPVAGHYEQACNAEDAKLSGAGISATTFDLNLLLNYLPNHVDIGGTFRAWASKAETLILKELTSDL